MTAIFIIVPEVLPVAVPGDLIGRFVPNFNFFPTGSVLRSDDDLVATIVRNTNTFGANALREGAADVNLTATIVSNTNVFGANTLSEAPADVNLRPTVVTNTNTFGASTLAEAPADGIFRATVVTNTNTFGSNALNQEDTVLDDGDPMIAGYPIGGVVS